MPTKQSGLAVVQQLYLLQTELLRFVQADEEVEITKQEAQKHMKEFSQLLHKADWQYMGGEDVLESLEKFETDMGKQLKTLKKIKQSSAKRQPVRSMSDKKKVAKTVKKKVTKRAISSKK